MLKSIKVEISDRFKVAFARNPTEAAVEICIRRMIDACPEN
jgi:hypothetical protein